MLQEIKQEQPIELKKHVNAIHCTNNLTLVQRKLFNALLFNAYSDLPNKAQFEIPARKLCALIGYNSNDYGKLKKALLALMTIAIEWNVIDYSISEKANKWRASSALSAAKLEEGMCTYEYSTLMRELLYRPEIYGRLNMAALSKFKSSYGLALYENTVRFQGLPYTPWMNYEVFRRLMGVFGTKYNAFKDFKKRVLEPAIEEVNEYSAIKVFAEVKRKNQKVTSLRFKLMALNSNQNNIKEITGDEELIDILTNSFSLTPETIKDLFSKYDLEYVKEKVTLIMTSDSFRLGKIRGLAGYLIEALKKNYQITNINKAELKNKKTNKNSGAVSIQVEQNEKISHLYKAYINAAVDAYLLSLESHFHQKLLDDFTNELKLENIFLYNWYCRDGLNHAAVRSCLNNFMKKRNPDLILSLEEFKNKMLPQHQAETFAG